MNAIADIRGSGLPVVIFGASTVGELLFHVCKEKGIPVSCFTDNNSGLFGQQKCGVEVVQPSLLKGRYPDANIMIAVADIKDIVDQVRLLGFSHIHSASELLRDADCGAYPMAQEPDFIEFVVTTLVNCHDAYTQPERIYLRSVDIVITERCSLKCQDCSNLMQYYEKPENYEQDDIVASIDGFCDAIDGVNEFRVIGGEPFMNKDIHLTIERLNVEPKVRKIVVYTNATILPRPHQLPSLKNEKVLMLITDYGALSKNTEAFVQTLEREGIRYFRRPAENWTACSKIGPQGRTQAQNEEVFASCCAKNLYTLLNGKLYRCPFAAHVDKLRAVPDFPEDYVDIVAARPIHERKAAIRDLIHNRKTLRSCNHCEGRFLSAPQIVPAIQVKKRLPYHVVR